ncbi:hypothetical protein [Streptomyces sp. NPDC017940]|uniref:hypothetical protein n=1 Tax=Streptomyces sp. NPDC017940 TaxID=3365017 RepID=UPI0037917C79
MPKTKTHTPKESGTEKAILRDTLDRLRNSIAANVTGVPEPDVRTAGVPSGTNRP